MSKLFDKDFFKFFLGFATIVSISLMVIIATKLYSEKQSQTANVIETVKK
jgi:hypothetical protein